MSTLDDKLLGEKQHYYCSSSEDDDDDDDDDDTDRDDVCEDRRSVQQTQFISESQIREFEGSSVNTGPKGVIKDWQRYKQLEIEKRDEQEKEKLELIKKLSLTCQSHLEDEKAKEKDEKEFQELMNDAFLKEYMQKRMQEMMKQADSKSRFCRLIKLKSGQEYLEAIEKEHPDVTVIIHIYTVEISGCEAMNGCLHCLAQEYPFIKFCCLEAASAGMSKHFEESGVPALLIYKGGQLIGNFVRLTDEFGDDFFAVDVESFLLEHGMLPDQSLVPTIIKTNNVKEDDKSDSDFDVE